MLIGPLHFSHELALFLTRSCTFLFAETPNAGLMVFFLVVGLHQVKISVCVFLLQRWREFNETKAYVARVFIPSINLSRGMEAPSLCCKLDSINVVNKRLLPPARAVGV